MRLAPPPVEREPSKSKKLSNSSLISSTARRHSNFRAHAMSASQWSACFLCFRQGKNGTHLATMFAGLYMKRTAEFAHAFAHSRNANARSDRHVGAGMH